VTVDSEARVFKLDAQVQQVTFAGARAAANDQRVLYVTERCVFELSPRGLVLAEVAPGVDLERDILQCMAFVPLMPEAPQPMDARRFADEPFGLRHALLDPDLARRIHCDAVRDTLFLNFQHLQVRRTADIEAIRRAVDERCGAVGHRVAVVVTDDGFQIAPGLEDAYAAMARAMQQRRYGEVKRYASGAFKRMKVGRALGAP
jgi:propionate CoA-transferase